MPGGRPKIARAFKCALAESKPASPARDERTIPINVAHPIAPPGLGPRAAWSPECARPGRESPAAVESQNQTNAFTHRRPSAVSLGTWRIIVDWTLELGVSPPVSSFAHAAHPPERRRAAGFGRPKTTRVKIVYAARL